MIGVFALVALMAAAATLVPVTTDERGRYPEWFPGIDLVVYTNKRGVKYDWIVSPGADPSAIRMKFGAAAIEPGGDLIVRTPSGLVRHTKPHTYQETGGTRRTIPSEFVVEPGGAVGFRVGEYDPALTLIIDPQVEWVAAFGNRYSYDQGTLHPRIGDTISDMAIDRDGNVWVTGMAYFSGFPLVNAIQNQCIGAHCTFVAKLSPDGTKILFSSYVAAPVQTLGWPALLHEYYFPSAIACDREGNVYVTGTSDASRLPLVDGTMAQSRGGNDVFLLKLDGRGVMKARMVFGGSGDDAGRSVALGHDGFVYIAGKTSSADFPVSSGAYRADRGVRPTSSR
jgi:beta-propeller repeat-containing protein